AMNAAQFCIHTEHINRGRASSQLPGASSAPRMSPEELISAVVSTVAAAKQEAQSDGERQHEEKDEESLMFPSPSHHAVDNPHCCPPVDFSLELPRANERGAGRFARQNRQYRGGGACARAMTAPPQQQRAPAALRRDARTVPQNHPTNLGIQEPAPTQ